MWASKASVPPRHRSPGPAQVPASHPGGIPGAIPRTHNALDPVLHRNDVEGFLDALPDLVQPLAAARADVALDLDYDIDAANAPEASPGCVAPVAFHGPPLHQAACLRLRRRWPRHEPPVP